MSSLTEEFKKGMATMLRSHHITEVLMLSETKEHSGKEAGHSASVSIYLNTEVQVGDLERL